MIINRDDLEFQNKTLMWWYDDNNQTRFYRLEMTLILQDSGGRALVVHQVFDNLDEVVDKIKEIYEALNGTVYHNDTFVVGRNIILVDSIVTVSKISVMMSEQKGFLKTEARKFKRDDCGDGLVRDPGFSYNEMLDAYIDQKIAEIINAEIDLDNGALRDLFGHEDDDIIEDEEEE